MDFKLLKELSCEICFGNFNDQGRCPRILLCGHTFCHECLKKMFSDSSLCPTCKTSFNYTSVDLIPVNFLVKSLLKKVKKELLVAKFSASNLMKENCSEPPMKKLRCLDCSTWACSQSEALIHEHCRTVHTAEGCKDIKLKVFEKAHQERSIRESTIMTVDDILEGLSEYVIDLHAMKLRENEFLEKLLQYMNSVEEYSDDDSFFTAMAKLEQLLRSGQNIHLKCLPEAAHIKKQILMSVCSKEACCLVINQGTDNARYGKLAVVDNATRIYSFQVEKPPKFRFIPINYIFPSYPGSSLLSKRIFLKLTTSSQRTFECVIELKEDSDVSTFAPFFFNSEAVNEMIFKKSNHHSYRNSLQLMNPSESGLQSSSQEFQTPFNCGSSIGRWELKYGASGLYIAWTDSSLDSSYFGLLITGQNELTRYSGGCIRVMDHGWII